MHPTQEQIANFCDAVVTDNRPEWARYWSLDCTPNSVSVLPLRLVFYRIGLIESLGNFYAPDGWAISQGLSPINAYVLFGSGFHLEGQPIHISNRQDEYRLAVRDNTFRRFNVLKPGRCLDFTGVVHPDFQTALAVICEIEE